MNETLEFAIVFDKYKPKEDEVKKMAKELYEIKKMLRTTIRWMNEFCSRDV